MAELEKHWEDVRRNAQLPFLPSPVWDETIDSAYINLESRQICVSPDFIEKLRENGLSEEAAVMGVLEHEVEHWRTHPYDLAQLLLELDSLDPTGEKGQRANLVQNLYSDIKINLSAVIHGRGDHILDVSDKSFENPVMRAIYAFMCEETGREVTLSHELTEKLGVVDFYARKRQDIIFNLKLFENIISPYLDGLNFSCDYSSDDFDKDDVKRAVKKLLREGEISPQRAERIMNNYGIENALIESYLAEASKYPVHVEPAPISLPSGSYPSSHLEWSVEHPTEHIDPFASFGLLAPGITKRWVDEEYVSHGVSPAMPDAVICLDTSGSMIRHSQNSPALVASLSLASKYLSNGGRVAPINFSCRTLFCNASSSVDEIARVLCVDQDGSTTLDLRTVQQAYESCRVPDVHIITDAEISNIGDVLAYLSERSGESRTNLWLIGTNQEFPGITCHYVEKAEDIPKVVIKNGGA